jgi:uncharacterized protein YcbK (DUF882 family)
MEKNPQLPVARSFPKLPAVQWILLRLWGVCTRRFRHKEPLRYEAGKKNGAFDSMTEQTTTRRALLRAFAATAVTAAPVMANATGFLRGAGDIRRLRMHNGRAGESLDMIYWIDGNYIRPAMREIDVFMRDLRDGTSHRIDARAIDIIAASHRLLDTSEPYMLLSGYRSPATNAALRNRSTGVARNSLHMRGEAADLRLTSRNVTQIFKAAQACNAGGVGRYAKSNFVHMDCGDVRAWGG